MAVELLIALPTPAEPAFQLFRDCYDCWYAEASAKTYGRFVERERLRGLIGERARARLNHWHLVLG